MPKFGTNCIVQTAGNGQLRRRLRQDQTQPSPPVPRATIRCGFWIFCGMQPIVAAILGDECWMRRYPHCPRWGKCREAAKGVSLVILSRCHSTNRTPSVSPYGLPAPPPGSQGMRQPPLKGEAAQQRRRGQARYAEYPSECTKANSYRLPWLPPGEAKGIRLSARSAWTGI